MPCSSNFVCGNRHADVDGWPVYYTDCDQLNIYAMRVLGNNSPFIEVVISSLATNRITYCKRTSGDCGSPGINISGGTQSQLASGYNLSQSASMDPEPISGTFLAATAKILQLFGQHHAQAVANEQNTLCQVADGWNSWIQSVESALQSGQINIQDAIAQLNQVYASLKNTARSVAKTTGDAANYYMAALDALKVWNQEIVFPSLAQQAGPLGGVASSLGITVPPALSAAGRTPTGTLIIYTGIGLVLLKLLGVL